MSVDRSKQASHVTAALVAEAAAWLAILHGPNRTTAVEQGFSKWLRTSAAHAQAFEQATEIWEESRNLPRTPPHMGVSARMSAVRPLLALAAGVALAVIGFYLYVQLAGVSTDLGEQRALILEDGTRVMMNTATRLVVRYDGQYRRVELKTGEAHFEVAKRPDWPFVVAAGTQQVTALGTAFTVRHENARTTVTLVEGKVSVQPRPPGIESFGASARRAAPEATVTLTPGERAVFLADHLATLDRPDLQKALAWQRREVAFDDTPLLEAVGEMNRYSVTPLAIEGAQAEHVRVTGLFRAGDSMSFARAVAAAYRLEVIEQEERLVLVSSAQRGGF